MDARWLGIISLTIAEVPVEAETKTEDGQLSNGEKGIVTTRVLKYRRKQWRG
jgi:hypothetical protein